MAFTTLTSEEIASGKPVANTLTQKIKDNFDNHEERIVDLESGTNTVYPPLIFRCNGYYGGYTTLDAFLKTTINFNITITGIRLLIDTAGSAGTTEVDVKYKRGGGSYTSVLSTKPSVGYASGNDALSTNAVLDSGEVDLQAGDILALYLTSVQTDGKSFLVRIDYNKTT
jgi:hypothetical protein